MGHALLKRSMRIVVLDGHTLDPGDNPWDEITALGELVVHARTDPSDVVARARGAEIVITNKTPLPAAVFEALDGLRLVAVVATGFDVVDCTAAARRGVAVANVPDYAADSVAQHTIALLLAVCQHVAEHDRAVHDGHWTSCPDFSFWTTAPTELAGRTIGIVGMGSIGRRVAEIAHAVGMHVRACSRSRRTAPPLARFSWAEMDEVFAHSDVVSLHCPLTPQTAGMVDAARLASMRTDAVLINTARGGLVDDAALATALHAGHLAGAALDVVSREPVAADNPLLAAPRCIITPHMAWSSLAARRRTMRTTAENIRAFTAGAPRNLVSSA